MAGNLGYLTYVVSDATATFDRIDPNGARYGAEQLHAIALSNLAAEYAQIVTTEEGDKERARARYVFYKKRGYDIKINPIESERRQGA